MCAHTNADFFFYKEKEQLFGSLSPFLVSIGVSISYQGWQLVRESRRSRRMLCVERDIGQRNYSGKKVSDIITGI